MKSSRQLKRERREERNRLYEEELEKERDEFDDLVGRLKIDLEHADLPTVLAQIVRGDYNR